MQQPEIRNRTTVLAVSLDETSTEIAKWNVKIPQLTGWKHARAEEGVRSKVANDYFILATPVMIVLDANNKEIIAMPNTPEELKNTL